MPREAAYAASEDGWVLHRGVARSDAPCDERLVWDRHGRLRERCLYGPEGALRELDRYEGGQLWMSKRWAAGELVQSFFYPEADPPVVRSATLYRDGGKDRTASFFDDQGRKFFSVRIEEVGPHHVRRYYDDRLVFEAIAAEDPSQPPRKVAYYDLSGALLISYAPKPTGAGAGSWTLHDATGAAALTLPEDDERSRNEYGTWDRFLPRFASYDESCMTDDPTCVREAFHEAHADTVLDARLKLLPVSPGLKAALGKHSWARVETAFGGGGELPMYVGGVLADDPALAEHALASIWPQIVHQKSVYAATYRVSAALAELLPSLTSRPAVERRVLEFLVEVLQLDQIKSDREAYAALVAALRPSCPRFSALASGSDEALARVGRCLLGHARRPSSGARARKKAKTTAAKTRAKKAGGKSAEMAGETQTRPKTKKSSTAKKSTAKGAGAKKSSERSRR